MAAVLWTWASWTKLIDNVDAQGGQQVHRVLEVRSSRPDQAGS